MYKEYYYFVAGLPNQSLEDGKLKDSWSEFRIELQKQLSTADYKQVEKLGWWYDLQNLLFVLNLRKGEWNEFGNFSMEEMQQEVAEPKELPGFLQTFLKHYRKEESLYPTYTWEQQLVMLFYHSTSKDMNPFLQQWFDLERNIRNILTALTCRTYNIPAEKQLVGDDEMTLALSKSQAADFGIGKEFPYMDKLLRIHDTGDLLERERALDALRWQWLEEHTFFDYFNINKILAYVLKRQITERWLLLDPGVGMDKFRQMMQDLENSFTFSEEFALQKRERV